MTQTVLGLTGSIGMGKSTTAAMFAEAGVPVWDADAAVHRIYGPEGSGAAALAEIVADAVLPDGSVSRDKLRAAIAEAPEILNEIEARVHPLVAGDRAAFLAAHKDSPVVLLDIPLLFETSGTDLVDKVVVVSTGADEQRRRVLARPGMDEASFERLLARQMPDQEKRARADFLIRTDDLATAQSDVKNVLKSIGAGSQDA